MQVKKSMQEEGLALLGMGDTGGTPTGGNGATYGSTAVRGSRSPFNDTEQDEPTPMRSRAETHVGPSSGLQLPGSAAKAAGGNSRASEGPVSAFMGLSTFDGDAGHSCIDFDTWEANRAVDVERPRPPTHRL